MRFLLTNDDGYQAPGLRALAESLEKLGAVTVVAPDRNRSGASNSLTLNMPIRAYQTDKGHYVVNGTPTDCVHVGVTALVEQHLDVVVSGINAGANLGDDVLYSGTVAAAIEASSFGLPALAVSLVGRSVVHYESAAELVRILVLQIQNHPEASAKLLNVNVPDLAREELAGVRVTRLGSRHVSEPVIKTIDPRGEPLYWIGPPGDAQDGGPGTDFHAVANGYVSVTPLQLDLTRHNALDNVSRWLDGMRIDER